MQAHTLECLNQCGFLFAHTLAMNIPWQKKAKSRMRDLKMQQQELADRLSVSPGTISHWLHGRHRPSTDQLRGIAKVLGVSLPELIEDDETFVRDELELAVLRQVRAIDRSQREYAQTLISAVIATLKQQQVPANPSP